MNSACTDVLATTYFSGPIVIVNGPVTEKIGMNWGHNALGQGNRANSTIGRALQLVIRNVGGGRPGGVDRATLGQPGKVGFCFAEREHDSYWESLAVERGFRADRINGDAFRRRRRSYGPAIMKSREPESLTRSLAMTLRTVRITARVMAATDALLVISPENMRVFRDAGWSKARFRQALDAEALTVDGHDMIAGADGVDEGMPAHLAQKFGY